MNSVIPTITTVKAGSPASEPYQPRKISGAWYVHHTAPITSADLGNDQRRRISGQRNPRQPVSSPSAASDEMTMRIGDSIMALPNTCLLYTSDAADEEDSVDLGGRRIIKKKKK